MTATAIVAATAAGISAGGTIVTATATDAVNGNSFIQDGRTLLRLVNTDASSRAVTFPYPVQVDGQTLASKVVTLAAGEIRYIAAAMGSLGGALYPQDASGVGRVVNFTSANALVKYELVNIPTYS